MKNKKTLKTIIKIVLYTALISLTTIFIYKYNQSENNPFKLKHITIKGNDYVNTEEIMHSILINKSESIFDCNIKNIKKHIEKIPFIKTAHISLKIPDKLEIQITEQIPIALIIYNNKKIFIDKQNNFLPANSKSINNFPVPILNITNVDLSKNNSILVIKYLYENYNSMYNNISEILESNTKITLITDTRTKIFVNPHMIINNITKLEKFEKTIQKIKKINDYKYIDLIYKNQIVAKEKIYS